jgi:alkylhydroperoxidase family enzyme
MARVPFIYEQKAPPEVDEIYQKMVSRGATVFNAHRVLAHNPSLLHNYMRLGNSLFNKTDIPLQLTELVILFIAELTDSEYTWAIHYPMALEIGLSHEQVSTISHWRSKDIYNPTERAVLGYVEGVIISTGVQCSTDQIFAEIKKYFNDKQIVELALLIGYYQMAISFTRILDIEIEDQSIMTLKQLIGNETPRCIES